MSAWLYQGALASSANRFDPLILPEASATPRLLVDADSTSNTIASSNFQTLFDQTGSGNHLTQGTAGNRPAVVSTWRNGRSAAQGAAGKQLACASLAAAMNGAVTVVIVGEAPASFTQQFPFGGGGGQKYIRILASSGQVRIGAGSDVGSLPLVVSTPFVALVTWSAAGTTSSVRIWSHGQAKQQETSLSSGTANLTSAGLFDLAGASGLPWLGKIAAFGLYDGALSSNDSTYILEGLAARYAIVPSP